MMSHPIRSIYPIFAILYLVVAPAVGAVQVRLSLTYAGSLAADGVTPIDTQLDPVTGSPNQNVPGSTHQYDVFLTLSGLSGNEDFQALYFDFVLAPGVTPAGSGGWLANNPQYDPGGGSQSLFSMNGDGGTDLNDLHTMIATVNGSAAGAAVEPGERGSFRLGTARVQWDGTLSDLNGLLGMQAHGDTPWGIYRDGAAVALGRTTFTIDSPVSWSDQPPVFDPPLGVPEPVNVGVVAGLNTPEPGSGLLAGIAVAAYTILFRRRSVR